MLTRRLEGAGYSPAPARLPCTPYKPRSLTCLRTIACTPHTTRQNTPFSADLACCHNVAATAQERRRFGGCTILAVPRSAAGTRRAHPVLLVWLAQPCPAGALCLCLRGARGRGGGGCQHLPNARPNVFPHGVVCNAIIMFCTGVPTQVVCQGRGGFWAKGVRDRHNTGTLSVVVRG